MNGLKYEEFFHHLSIQHQEALLKLENPIVIEAIKECCFSVINNARKEIYTEGYEEGYSDRDMYVDELEEEIDALKDEIEDLKEKINSL